MHAGTRKFSRDSRIHRSSRRNYIRTAGESESGNCNQKLNRKRSLSGRDRLQQFKVGDFISCR